MFLSRHMIKKIVFVSFVALFQSCSQVSLQDQTAFHDDGRKKPIVCLLGVFDSTVSDLPWSLSEEFTTQIQQTIMKSRQLFLVQDYPLVNYLLQQDRNYKPFLQDLNVLHNLPLQSEFVVFMELIQHSLEHKTDKISFSDQLQIALRLRIIDLRGKIPKIILQELYEKRSDILSSMSYIDYKNYPWGSSSFSVLPLGIAHQDFCRNLAERIEEYILVAKFR
ncbi:MAG: hypothetical protein KGQ54_00990 [Verrucomicrobia bacterium]|nr:hypothetical protein [Verrucomicrobiota bacterium]NDE62849.1 hypothetical protein [Chlamydiota bacterium]